LDEKTVVQLFIKNITEEYKYGNNYLKAKHPSKIAKQI
jgi:hypothetical protein